MPAFAGTTEFLEVPFLLSDFTAARPGIWRWRHGASRQRLPIGSQRRWRLRVVLSDWHARAPVEVVERETFESALMAGRHALEVLGFDRFRARDMANIFRRRNISITEAMIPHFDDDDRLVSAAKAGRDELAEQFANDRRQFEKEHSSKGWHRHDVDK